MKLLVVESPKKARTIRGFLGDGYCVEASMGHVREIPPKGINVDIQNGFVPTFAISKGKGEVVKTIKDLAKKAEIVYLATDKDREGEAIAWHLYDLMDASSKKKCKRVTYGEISKSAVLKGIQEARDIDMHLVDAQKARQVLDRLIGYKASPLLWRTVGRGTSAGRVQSIALKLICDRQKEIDAFKSITYWFVEALLKCQKGEFWAKVVVPKDKDNRFLKNDDAEKAFAELKKAKYTLVDVESKQKTIVPKPPFDTTELQASATAILRWGATKTMKVAQSLYENGHITYLRTDSYDISQEAMDEVRGLVKEYGGKYLPSKPNTYHKKSTVAAQEAHECVRPAHLSETGESFFGEDKELYQLIRDRFISCQMTPMVVNGVKYTVKASSGHELVATGQTIGFDGFSKVWKHTKVSDEELPEAKKGEELTFKDAKCTQHATKPPDRYNDATIVRRMEADGVGRPSTQAKILQGLSDREYVTKDKNAFIPTPLGMLVSDFLTPVFAASFMDIKFTADLEGQLDDITSGKKQYLQVVEGAYGKLKEEISKAQKDSPKQRGVPTGSKCLVCKKGDILEIPGRFGKFFSCGNYPDCKTVYTKTEAGFEIKAKKEPPKDTGRKCPQCGKSLVVRKSSYGEFIGCIGYPKCRFIEKDGKKSRQDTDKE